ncbi:hypothetical protein ACOMHN_037171 [Nucella lapillus]
MNSSAFNISETNCIVVGWNSTTSNDRQRSMISSQLLLLLVSVKNVILLPILAIIEGPANVLNMVVFFKQGLNERINLCLFCLALVDLCFLVFIF